MPIILPHLAFTNFLPLAVGALYAILSVHFWRSRWQATTMNVPATGMRKWERISILGALLLHAGALYQSLFGADGMRFSFSLALSLMLCLAVLIYWLESFFSRMDGLQPMVLPIAAVCAALPVLFTQTRLVAHVDVWPFKFHFLSAMLAYSLFMLAALHAIFMSFVEQKLRSRSLENTPLSSLPPILTMESVLFKIIGVAFFLLTVALLSGLLFSETIFGKAFVLDHKNLFSFISWGIFAALLIGRKIYGWRGRIALRWTLTGFMVLLLAYVGSRFVSEVLLGRI